MSEIDILSRNGVCHVAIQALALRFPSYLHRSPVEAEPTPVSHHPTTLPFPLRKPNQKLEPNLPRGQPRLRPKFKAILIFRRIVGLLWHKSCSLVCRLFLFFKGRLTCYPRGIIKSIVSPRSSKERQHRYFLRARWRRLRSFLIFALSGNGRYASS